MILDDAHEVEVDEENYFVSMTDMMVGLVFIFIIVVNAMRSIRLSRRCSRS